MMRMYTLLLDVVRIRGGPVTVVMALKIMLGGTIKECHHFAEVLVFLWNYSPVVYLLHSDSYSSQNISC